MGQGGRAGSAPLQVGYQRGQACPHLQGRQSLYPLCPVSAGLSAKAHDPYVKGFFEHLIANGKTPLQGVCAVMRKLLHAIHGMFAHNQPFNNSRFYELPA